MLCLSALAVRAGFDAVAAFEIAALGEGGFDVLLKIDVDRHGDVAARHRIDGGNRLIRSGK